MRKLRFIYDSGYNFGRGIPFLREVHGFVLDKPARIRKRLVERGVAAEFERPPRLRERELSAIYPPELLARLRSSRAIAEAAELAVLAALPAAVARHLVVSPQVRASSGTALANSHAARGDWAFNLSGGFHHAGPRRSHGFCLVSDVAWAVSQLRKAGSAQRILVLDLDLHQGDGNAEFFADDASVFTASLHEEAAFPTPKSKSDLDVGLRSRVGDAEYLRALEGLLEAIDEKFKPEILVYVAGTDPFRDDPLGGFEISSEGMRERDERVALFAAKRNLGVVALPAGGYSPASPGLSADGFAAMASVAQARS